MSNQENVDNPSVEEQKAPQIDSNEFFDALDNDVQGGMFEELDQEAPVQNEATPQAAPQQKPQENNTDWKQRYDSSSDEGRKMRTRLNELEPYSALLDVMRKDQGLVSTVRDYLQNGGGTPKSIREEVGVDEDFEFDANEAFSNPESKSGQVFDKMMNNHVTKRINNVMASERAKTEETQAQMQQMMTMKKFQEEKGLTDEQMNNFVSQAQSHTLTYDDAWNIVNKEQNNANVAQSTKADMLKQMQNTRSFPTTAAASNSVGVSENPTDSIFDMLKDSDGDIDNLFG